MSGGKPAFKQGAPSSSAGGQVAKVFESIQTLLGETYVASTQAVFQFDLKGAYPSSRPCLALNSPGV